jgi:hypothetical protein
MILSLNTGLIISHVLQSLNIHFRPLHQVLCLLVLATAESVFLPVSSKGEPQVRLFSNDLRRIGK